MAASSKDVGDAQHGETVRFTWLLNSVEQKMVLWDTFTVIPGCAAVACIVFGLLTRKVGVRFFGIAAGATSICTALLHLQGENGGDSPFTVLAWMMFELQVDILQSRGIRINARMTDVLYRTCIYSIWCLISLSIGLVSRSVAVCLERRKIRPRFSLVTAALTIALVASIGVVWLNRHGWELVMSPPLNTEFVVRDADIVDELIAAVYRVRPGPRSWSHEDPMAWWDSSRTLVLLSWPRNDEFVFARRYPDTPFGHLARLELWVTFASFAGLSSRLRQFLKSHSATFG